MIDTFLETMKLKGGTPIVSADLLDWLIEKGFFKAPASISHHGNYEGGLFRHSLEVTECLLELTHKMGIKWQNERSPYIVGMFHDLCKLDDYVYDDYGWKHSNFKIFSGHGEKSILLLSQFITLTEEEILCIRFHMGAYETDSWDSYDRAIKQYETVLWTHFADMYASKISGV